MRSLVVVCAVVAAFAVAPVAAGGGWAAVGFEPLPDGTSAGATWSPTIFVKQHGITPLAGLQPVVSIHDDQTGAAREFLAEPGSEAGVYRADVVFPSEGEWRVIVHSGFGDSQVTYGPVSIGSGGVAGGDGLELPVVGLGVALLALLGGVGLLGVRRTRRMTPAA